MADDDDLLTTFVAMATDENFTTVVPPSDINPPIRKCNYFITTNNRTVVFDFSNQYGGIPQNLAFNLIGWFVLMLLFAFLRRAAGNYGRLALVRNREGDSESRWTQLFFAPDDVAVENEQDAVVFDATSAAGDANVRQAENAGQRRNFSSIDYSAEEAVEDRKTGAWILSIFTLTDDQFMRKCGLDAVQYLRFQRHLIFFMFVISVACIAIILPINFQGDLQGTEVDFGHTTISNLKGSDSRLWVHAVLVVLFFPLGIAIMRHFSVTLGISEESSGEDSDISSRTLMISAVPDTYCTKEFISRHIGEAYAWGDALEDVQVAYDVSRLLWLDKRRQAARKARLYCENEAAKYGAGQQMSPVTCGIICPATCCCVRTVDAVTFYKREELEYATECQRESAKAKTKSIGIAFVTFKSIDDAKTVLKDHKAKGSCCYSNPPGSSLSNLLEPWKWRVRVAPPPEDIYWENLNDSHNLFFLKTFFINLIVFIMLFFFTSPAYIISQLELIINLKSISAQLPEKINDFIPTLLLWTLSALLPIIVAYSDWWMGHWRRSVENLWIMRKVFFYLLFMVLILPSIGLTSLMGLLQLIIDANRRDHGHAPANSTMMWNCIFLPDNGAFFVNYVITSTLVGTALEFMRFSELFMYAARLMVARSMAEVPSVRSTNLYEFPFGFNYGWMLLVFALAMAYGVVCPLITPFGLLYLVFKHGVDRYNLYYAYKRSKINKNIHATAVNCVMVSLLIQQLVLFFFNFVRGQNSLSARAIFSVAMLALSASVYIAQVFFHIFKGISPIQYTYQGSAPADNCLNEADEQESVDETDDESGRAENSRPFVGFCNPEDVSTINESVATSRKRRRAKHYLPDVLKYGVEGRIFLRNLNTDNAPTFSYASPPASSYGATDLN